jgi:hypothetical protein
MAAPAWARRGLAVPLVATAFALAALGCGSDEETTAPPVRPTPATAPGQTDTAATEATTTEQTNTGSSGGVGPTDTTTPETTETDNGGGGGGGGGVSPPVDPSAPDSPTNDVPAQPGTPQGNFEQYCNEHPGACGD